MPLVQLYALIGCEWRKIDRLTDAPIKSYKTVRIEKKRLRIISRLYFKKVTEKFVCIKKVTTFTSSNR